MGSLKIKNSALAHVTPESVGVKSEVLADFIRELNEKQLGVHSFTVVRHDKVCAQCFWAPYGPDSPHTLYSVSKSFTSTAVGFAVDEGLIGLDDPVYTYFPECQKYFVGSRIRNVYNRALTVRMLLTMRSGKMISSAEGKNGKNWIKDFFKASFMMPPDTKFKYCSENTFILSALIKRVTGKSTVDYLDEKMFRPLGIEKPFWQTDGEGNNAGGWGLYMRSEDLAKFFLPYLHGGKYKGEQLIPAAWVEQATAKQTATVRDGVLDNMCGYGFQFWRNPMPNSFRAEGLFGQRCVMFPEYDALVVLNSGRSKDYDIMEVFWKYFPQCFEHDAFPENETAYRDLLDTAAACQMEDLPAAPRNAGFEQYLGSKTLHAKTTSRTSVMPVAVSMWSYEKCGKISDMQFDFDEKGVQFTWRECDGVHTLFAGMNGAFGISDVAYGREHYHTYAKAAWTDGNRLQLWIRFIETAHVKKLTFIFSDDGIKVLNMSDPKFEELPVFYLVFSGVDVRRFGEKVIEGAVRDVGMLFLEPDFSAKLKNRKESLFELTQL